MLTTLTGRRTASAVAACLALVVYLGAAARAQAFIYWGQEPPAGVGRANIDGTAPNQKFVAPGTVSVGVAVDHGHLYWMGSTAIARANLDGSGLQQSFIAIAGGGGSGYGVAVDAGHVYWANQSTNAIGRANLDGTGVNQSFITGANSPQMVAVANGYIYWANYNDGTIGRARVDGSGVNESFVTTGSFGVEGVAVDSSHIYWTVLAGPGNIGRANINGTGVDASFITGANYPDGIAEDGGHLYWANSVTPGTIGRANLDGTGVKESFITGTTTALGIAIDPAPAVSAVGPSVGPAGGGTSVTITGGNFLGASAVKFGASPAASFTVNSPTQITAVSPPGAGAVDVTVTTQSGASTPSSADRFDYQSPPSLTDVGQTHRRWREGTALSRAAHGRPPIGTTFRYTLSEQAQVQFAFTQLLPGRRANGRCVAQTRRNKHKPRCTRTILRGALGFAAAPGTHKLRFAGRISKHKKLKPGRYRLSITATDSFGQVGTATLTFTIVPG
jgi:sugar lactone lactonase YvrE